MLVGLTDQQKHPPARAHLMCQLLLSDLASGVAMQQNLALNHLHLPPLHIPRVATVTDLLREGILGRVVGPLHLVPLDLKHSQPRRPPLLRRHVPAPAVVNLAPFRMQQFRGSLVLVSPLLERLEEPSRVHEVENKWN